MPTIEQRKAAYQAQSDLNASAYAEFMSFYPDAVPGRRFYDDFTGLTYEVVFLWRTNEEVNIIAAWVNDEGFATSYQESYFNLASIVWIPAS
jgi:hypothetical protein